jgi:ketosteroid isomerase-like protein
VRNTLISGRPPSRRISSTRRRASSIASSSESNFSLPTLDPCRTVTFQLTGTQTSLGYCAAMSRENVEVVQEGLRLWGLSPEGGLAPIDLDRLQEVFEGDTTAAAELFDPEVELHPPEGEVGGRLQRGYRGIVQNWRDLLATFDEFLIEPLEFHEAGEQVVVIQRNIGRMRDMEIDETFSVLFTLRDSRIARIEVFASRDGALAAASAA